MAKWDAKWRSGGAVKRARDPWLTGRALRPLPRVPVRWRRCGAARGHANGRGRCSVYAAVAAPDVAGHTSGSDCRAPR